MSETRPLEEAELGVNDLSVCKGHGSKGTGMIGSGKTPLTPWQSLPQVICSLPLSSLLSVSLFSPVSSPVSHSCPLPPCLSPPFCPRCLLRMCLCLSFSLYLTQPLIHSQAVLLSPFFSIPSEPVTLSLWTCVFSYPSISSPLSLSQSFSVVVAPLQCLKLQMIDKSP